MSLQEQKQAPDEEKTISQAEDDFWESSGKKPLKNSEMAYFVLNGMS